MVSSSFFHGGRGRGGFGGTGAMTGAKKMVQKKSKRKNKISTLLHNL